MTRLAVIVVPLVIPSTRTLSPLAMAPAELELVPFWYVVEASSLTVTFCPVHVDIVKLGGDTLSTLPSAPPAAGPDRAFDPPLPDTGCPDIADGDVTGVPLALLVLELDSATA